MIKKHIKKSVFMLVIITFLSFLLIPFSLADVTYTRSFTGTNGNISIDLRGLELENSTTYEFSIVKENETPTTWHEITEKTDYAVTIELDAEKEDIAEVLKTTDTGYLFVRAKNDGTNYIASNYAINLKLPYTSAVSYDLADGWIDIKTLYEDIGKGLEGTGTTSHKIVKITDKDLLNGYFQNKDSITSLESTISNDVPTTGYEDGGYFTINNLNKGLYEIWVKMSGENCKDVIGVIFYDSVNSDKLSDYTNDLSDDTIIQQEHKYEIVKGKYSWTEAKAKCEEMGGHLATIHNQEEQEEIEQITGGSQSLWIGGYLGDDGEWHWVTGQPWNYSNWGDGEPNNSGNVMKGEKYVAIWPKKWNDLANKSTEQSGFICEWGDSYEWLTEDQAPTDENDANTDSDINKDNSEIKDTTVASGELPQTGYNTVLIILSSIIIVLAVVLLYIKNKKYKDIK